MATPTAYSLPSLDYAFSALEPHIDEATMKVHYQGHHQGYTDKLNQAIEGLRGVDPALAALPVETLLQRLESIPDKFRAAIRNSGGGYVNHCLFWKWLSPSGGGAPEGDLAAAIASTFGDVSKFREDFSAAAATVFGSGWAWLVLDKRSGSPVLRVVATPNQDSPAMEAGVHVLLGLDVWEHAYYLKYQNKRAAYISAFWNVVNWAQVDKLYKAAL